LQVYIQIIEHWQLRHGKCPNCSTTFEYVQIGSTGKHQIYCPKAGCGYMINSAACSGGTHANEGKCQYCYYKYQTHSQTTTISTYTKTTTTHEPAYKCSYSGCTTTFRGTPKNHGGGTHQNGGKCTVCGKVYELHQKSTTVDSYTKTATGHTPKYKCTVEGCTATYEGTEQPHEYSETCTNNEDGTHTTTCTVCEQGKREVHTYENDKCTKCDAEKPKEDTQCTHSYEKKNSNIQHWEVCTKCKEVKTESLEEHTISNERFTNLYPSLPEGFSLYIFE